MGGEREKEKEREKEVVETDNIPSAVSFPQMTATGQGLARTKPAA